MSIHQIENKEYSEKHNFVGRSISSIISIFTASVLIILGLLPSLVFAAEVKADSVSALTMDALKGTYLINDDDIRFDVHTAIINYDEGHGDLTILLGGEEDFLFGPLRCKGVPSLEGRWLQSDLICGAFTSVEIDLKDVTNFNQFQASVGFTHLFSDSANETVNLNFKRTQETNGKTGHKKNSSTIDEIVGTYEVKFEEFDDSELTIHRNDEEKAQLIWKSKDDSRLAQQKAQCKGEITFEKGILKSKIICGLPVTLKVDLTQATKLNQFQAPVFISYYSGKYGEKDQLIELSSQMTFARIYPFRNEE